MSNYYLVKLYFNINDYISEQTDTVIAITDSLEKAKDIISEYYVDNFTEAEKSKVEFTINERTNDME
ncbi:hypothetical protein, partial [Pseudomonas oryzihabitans]|uniref:hypothetical protein n=1 Tax=Pseudomonas oryzihabitans TaxID=47885 RepID=UPI002B1D1C2B